MSSSASSRSREATALVGLAVLLVAGTVAVGVRTSPLLIGGGVLALSLVVVGGWRGRHWWSSRALARPKVLPARYRWLPAAWLIFAFTSVQKFTSRSLHGESVVSDGRVSLENAIELGFYAGVVAVMLVSWIRRAPWTRPNGNTWLFVWPCWAFLTTAWSLQPTYTGVRAGELFVPALFAVYTARVLDRHDLPTEAVLGPFLRLFVGLGILLAVWAFAAPYVPPGFPADSPRLAWYGVQPIVASEVFGVASLFLAAAGRGLLRLTFLGWAVRLVFLLVATVQTEGRSTLLGLVLAVVLVLVARTRERHLARFLGIIYYVALLAGAVFVLAGPLLEAATRGEGTASLTSLNGRLGVWQLALSEIHTIRELFIGFGLGSSRQLLVGEIGFAGHAHNSAIEALLSGGVIGLLLLVAWLVGLAQNLRTVRLARPLTSAAHASVVALYGLLLVLSLGSPELAAPGFSYSLLSLCAVAAIRSRPADVLHPVARPRPAAEPATLAIAVR